MTTLSLRISCVWVRQGEGVGRGGHVSPRPVWDENTAGVEKREDLRVKELALGLKIAFWDGTAMKLQQTIKNCYPHWLLVHWLTRQFTALIYSQDIYFLTELYAAIFWQGNQCFDYFRIPVVLIAECFSGIPLYLINEFTRCFKTFMIYWKRIGLRITYSQSQ